jgi:hypothetical protein
MTKAKISAFQFVRALFVSEHAIMPCHSGGAVSVAEHVSTAGERGITFNE